MNLEVRDVLTLGVLIASVLSMILVSRNARRATAVNAQNVDLARIRELRAEVQDVRSELGVCKEQASELSRKLGVANRDGAQAWTELAELKRMAHRPDMTMPRFREYVGPLPAAELSDGQ